MYDDGYTKDSQTIMDFWSIVHSLPDGQKRKLLFFATGSDRSPIKGTCIHPFPLTPCMAGTERMRVLVGLSNLPFVISRNGTDNNRLPTAHTCFNHLLLPEYASREILHQRLLTAMENAEGFGLM